MQMTSATVLTAFIAWTMFLVIVMEVLRTRYLLTRAVAANEFKPDNSNLPTYMQRIARAHANCVESFPVVGGLLVVAILIDRTDVTDPLAPWLFVARLVQSFIHVISGNVIASWLRFIAYAVQIAIAVRWSWVLLGS